MYNVTVFGISIAKYQLCCTAGKGVFGVYLMFFLLPLKQGNAIMYNIILIQKVSFKMEGSQLFLYFCSYLGLLFLEAWEVMFGDQDDRRRTSGQRQILAD